jgi:hypothetical protein
MQPSRRLVVLDPGLAAAVGHHVDLNGPLQRALLQGGWQVELWADTAAAGSPELQAALPGLRPVLQEAGYIDPRHWCDLPGCLHQAGLLKPQLQQAAAASGLPVAVWLAHSLVPFQLIALAQLLQLQPPARVLISLMFAPGEVFGGQSGLDLSAQRQAAEASASAAIAALALACHRGGHQLLLAAGSQQLAERYVPLCAAAGLPPPVLHPAVVALEPAWASSPPANQGRQILLHWGERKPDKGRELALALIEHLLNGPALPAGLVDVQWCFHAASRDAAPPAETALLQRAAALPQLTLLEGHQPRQRMLLQLASSDLALLPYCPLAYAERSSGVLWLYGAARLAGQQPARVAGFAGGWLAHEAPALGLQWQTLPDAAEVVDVLVALDAALDAPPPDPQLNAYGRHVLGASFATWVVNSLDADSLQGNPPP